MASGFFYCDKCECKGTATSSMKEHIFEMHISSIILTCDKCDFRFSVGKLVLVHFKDNNSIASIA